MEFRRLRHKIFALVIIAMILFFYFSFTQVVKKQGVDLKTLPGLTEATKIYYSWLVSIFHNTVTLTANAIKLDWSSNQSSVKD